MKTSNNYLSMEECVLASLLIMPEYMEHLIVEEKHFHKYKFVFNFFKEIYGLYHTLDINIMFSCVKDTSEELLIKSIENLLDVFVLPNRCLDYQKRLIKECEIFKREEFIKKEINKLTTSLNVGKINVQEYREKLDDIYSRSNIVSWK